MWNIKAPISVVAGLLIFWFCVFVIGIGFDRLLGFFDPPSVFITIGVTGGYMLFAFGASDLLSAFAIGLCGKAPTEKEALKAVEVYRVCAYCFVFSGIIGTLLGLINMFSAGMDDPSVLTSGVAVALITVLYGVCAAAFCVALEGRCRNAIVNLQSMYSRVSAGGRPGVLRLTQNRVKRPVLLVLAGAVLMLVLLVVLTVVITMIDHSGSVLVQSHVKNGRDVPMMFVPDPQLDGKSQGYRWDKPILMPGESTTCCVRIWEGRGVTSLKYSAVDMANGKLSTVDIPGGYLALLLDADFEFVIDDKDGLRRMDTPVDLPENVESTQTP